MAHIEQHTPVLGFNFGFLWPTRRNLTAELAAIGINPIAQSRVDAHISADYKKRRQSTVHHVLALLFLVLNVLTLDPLLKLLVPKLKIVLRTMLCAAVATLMAIVWMSTLHNLSGYGDVAFLVPAATFFSAFLLDYFFPQLSYIVGRWEKDHLSAYEGYPRQVDQSAAYVTDNISDAKAFIVHDDRDPFLQIEIGSWPFRQKAVIEAWSTGDRTLDTLGYEHTEWP